MRKPVVDYRQFRLSKINTPQFSHLKLLGGWFLYFVLFYLTERFIPAQNCYVVHSPLDDMIPFMEIFIVPYVFWYVLIALTLVYFALYNVENFKGFQKFIMASQFIPMLIYIVFPTMQELRPNLDEIARSNIFKDLVGFLYTIDTNTNVCPSMHVAYSIGIASAWLKEKSASTVWKIFIVVNVILICLSTAFIKQHSVIDAFAAIPVCIVAEVIAFGKNFWLQKFKRNKV